MESVHRVNTCRWSRFRNRPGLGINSSDITLFYIKDCFLLSLSKNPAGFTEAFDLAVRVREPVPLRSQSHIVLL